MQNYAASTARFWCALAVPKYLIRRCCLRNQAVMEERETTLQKVCQPPRPYGRSSRHPVFRQAALQGSILHFPEPGEDQY